VGGQAESRQKKTTFVDEKPRHKEDRSDSKVQPLNKKRGLVNVRATKFRGKGWRRSQELTFPGRGLRTELKTQVDALRARRGRGGHIKTENSLGRTWRNRLKGPLQSSEILDGSDASFGEETTNGGTKKKKIIRKVS